MNNFNFNNLDALLKMASSKAGKSPEELKKAIESGNANDIISGLDENSKNKINMFLNNPAALNQLAQNPQIRELLSKLK